MEIMQKLLPGMLRARGGMMFTQQDYEDYAQDIMLNVHSYLLRLLEPKEILLYAWLGRVVSNYLLTQQRLWIRKRQHTISLVQMNSIFPESEEGDPPDPNVDVEEEAISAVAVEEFLTSVVSRGLIRTDYDEKCWRLLVMTALANPSRDRTGTQVVAQIEREVGLTFSSHCAKYSKLTRIAARISKAMARGERIDV